MNEPNYFQQGNGGFAAFNGSGFPQHAKTYSLPVNMPMNHIQQQQQQQMMMGPLPPGWSSEKAPNGQPYFIK